MPLGNLDSRQGPENPKATKPAALFFQGLTQQAALAGVAVDVLAVGQAAVNVPLLGPLTQKTGGTIMTHQRASPAAHKQLYHFYSQRLGLALSLICNVYDFCRSMQFDSAAVCFPTTEVVVGG